MCGRYAITLTPELYRDQFGYAEQPNFPPRYNVAPTQPVPVVLEHDGARHFKLMRWGFLPGFVKDPKTFPLIINARADGLLQKPSFRNAVRRRRCIFLADAFYEWAKDDKPRPGQAKTPWLIRRRDGGPLPFAGLYETWHAPDGSEIDTAAIVTTEANAGLAGLHDRMPAILAREDFSAWLAGEAVEAAEALSLIRPAPEDWLERQPIVPAVNKVANDGPELWTPAEREAATPAGPRAQAGAEAKSEDEAPARTAQGSLF